MNKTYENLMKKLINELNINPITKKQYEKDLDKISEYCFKFKQWNYYRETLGFEDEYETDEKVKINHPFLRKIAKKFNLDIIKMDDDEYVIKPYIYGINKYPDYLYFLMTKDFFKLKCKEYKRSNK